LREGTTFTSSGAWEESGGGSGGGADVAANSSPHGKGAFTNTLDLSDLPDLGGATTGAEELRFSGLTPRESPVTLHSADVQITKEDGTTTLSAPIYGGYIVRCFALGYFTGSR
jgi:hypothetical protein